MDEPSVSVKPRSAPPVAAVVVATAAVAVAVATAVETGEAAVETGGAATEEAVAAAGKAAESLMASKTDFSRATKKGPGLVSARGGTI